MGPWHLAIFADPIDLPRIEQHHPSSNRREDAVHFEGLDRVTFRKDGFDQGAQLGNVPLSVAELIELAADRVLRSDYECVAKGTAHKPDGQVGIEHEQAFTDRLYEIQSTSLTAGSCAPCDDGAHPRQQLLERALRPPCLGALNSNSV